MAPEHPRHLSIPVLGISQARIIALDAKASGKIRVPDNIYDVGWYTGSAKPVLPGAMFMYGHVSSWTAYGVFYDLKRLKLAIK